LTEWQPPLAVGLWLGVQGGACMGGTKVIDRAAVALVGHARAETQCACLPLGSAIRELSDVLIASGPLVSYGF
jgi:hypothetical protein